MGHMSKQCPKPPRKKTNAVSQVSAAVMGTDSFKAEPETSVSQGTGKVRLASICQFHPVNAMVTPLEYREAKSALSEPDSEYAWDDTKLRGQPLVISGRLTAGDSVKDDAAILLDTGSAASVISPALFREFIKHGAPRIVSTMHTQVPGGALLPNAGVVVSHA